MWLVLKHAQLRAHALVLFLSKHKVAPVLVLIQPQSRILQDFLILFQFKFPRHLDLTRSSTLSNRLHRHNQIYGDLDTLLLLINRLMVLIHPLLTSQPLEDLFFVPLHLIEHLLLSLDHGQVLLQLVLVAVRVEGPDCFFHFGLETF